MVSNGLDSDGTPVFVSPMPSVSATGFGSLGVTFAVWFVIGGVPAEGVVTLEAVSYTHLTLPTICSV